MKPISTAAVAPFVQACGVDVVYPGGTQAISGLDLALVEGGFASIVGPSGCGKSTLLKALAGLVPVSRGSLQFGAGVASGGSGDGHDVAFVFQQPTLLSWRTVAGNVRLPLELNGGDQAKAAARVHDVLEWVGLADFAQALPAELSGGMQMRASLARALVTRPHLLLMDEPFAALDDITRQRLNEDVAGLWQRDRWTALFVTHNVAEAVFLSQRILVMSSRPGRIMADIPVELPFPRQRALRTTAAFNACVERVSRALYETGGGA